MAATDPHNNTGVMVAKLFFDMTHLPLFATEACRSSGPPYVAGKPRRFALSSMPTPGFGRCDRDHQTVDCDCRTDPRGEADFTRRMARFPTTPLPTAGINAVRRQKYGRATMK